MVANPIIEKIDCPLIRLCKKESAVERSFCRIRVKMVARDFDVLRPLQIRKRILRPTTLSDVRPPVWCVCSHPPPPTSHLKPEDINICEQKMEACCQYLPLQLHFAPHLPGHVWAVLLAAPALPSLTPLSPGRGSRGCGTSSRPPRQHQPAFGTTAQKLVIPTLYKHVPVIDELQLLRLRWRLLLPFDSHLRLAVDSLRQ